MTCAKTGRVLELQSPAPEPYQLWSCDEWRCEGCGATVLAGYGRGPMEEAEVNPEGYWALRAYEVADRNLVTIEA
jgi:hypothetical protein